MVEYWNCGELPWPDIEEFVDQNVGEALKHYIEKEGILIVDWEDEPEPFIKFATEGDFHYSESLLKILVYEIGNLRPGGPDDNDLFYDPEGDRRVILLQELVLTYFHWMQGGVHQPAKEPDVG